MTMNVVGSKAKYKRTAPENKTTALWSWPTPTKIVLEIKYRLSAVDPGAASRLFFALVIAVAVLPVAGWRLALTWFLVMAGLIAIENHGTGRHGQRAAVARSKRDLCSWLLGAGYSSAAFYLVLFHTGAAQTLGVTLYGVIMFEILIRDYEHPRRLALDLLPPVLSVALVQVVAASSLVADHRSPLILTLVASPVVVFWMFRTLQDRLTQNMRGLTEAAAQSEVSVQQIREAHRIALLAEDLAGVSHWRLDRRTRSFIWSEGVYRIFGLDPAAALPSVHDLYMMWAPEDRDRVRQCMALAMRDGTPFSTEARLVRADGQVRHVVSNAAVERDETGAVATVFGAFLDVTEARVREQALSRSEEQFRLLADKSNDVIMQATIAPDGRRRMTYISPAIEKILGYAPSYDPGAMTLDYIHPDDVGALVRSNLEQIQQGPNAAPRTNVYRARHRDGSWVWLEGKPTFTFDPETAAVCGMITVMRDVTAQKRADEAIRLSEERFRQMAENATDTFCVMDMTGAITFVTQACERLLGYRPEDMIGVRSQDLMHPDDAARIVALYTDYIAAGPTAERITIQYRSRHRDGHLVWIEGQPTVIFDAKGVPVSIQDVVRDISPRKAVELELARALAAAEVATVAKSDFLANMSHEIRTPLTAILGFSAMLEGVEILDDAARLYVQRILTSGRSLLSVVNDILDFSKLEADQLVLDPQPFAPAEFIQDTINVVAAQADNRGLDLDLRLDADLPALVEADSSRLRQVLLNLLSNAVKFTAEGKVTIRASYQAAGGLLRMSVADTGSGIAAEKLPRLFERFSQVDGSISRRHGGTGLGLAICKNLVKLMGGEIQVESVEGEGSTFSFAIAAPESAATPVNGAAAEEVAAPAAQYSAHILVVDDVAENRELVRLILQAVGHRVDEAACGADAIAAAIAQPFDLILMDIQMPGMDGLTACQLIRETAKLNITTPILALSANVMAGQVAECLAAGMNDHIAKPIEIRDLLAKVAGWTGECEATPEPALIPLDLGSLRVDPGPPAFGPKPG